MSSEGAADIGVSEARAARARAIVAALGEADEAARPLARAIRGLARAHFDRAVVPLVAAHWPAVVGTPFADKLRIGACDLYAAAPYTALVCGDGSSRLMRLAARLADGLPLSDRGHARVVGAVVAAAGRALGRDLQARVARVAALIVVVDHVFDHVLTTEPDARGATLRAALRGEGGALSPPLALTRALVVALGRGLRGRRRRDFEAAMGHLGAWLDAEVAALRGDPDAEGLGHRRAGVVGTIEGLLFPVAPLVGPEIRAWLVDVSMFVQLVDDVLDLEADAAAGRETLAVTGVWRVSDVGAAFEATLAGLARVATASRPGARRLPGRMVATYRMMMVELVEAMVARPEDGRDDGGGAR